MAKKETETAEKPAAKKTASKAKSAAKDVEKTAPKTAAKAEEEPKKVAAKPAAKTASKTASKSAAKTKKEVAPEPAPEVKAEPDVTASIADNETNTELSVEQRLYNLFKLQTMLTEIDKIKTLRGELPLEVQDLEDEVAGLQTRIQNFQLDSKDIDTNIGQQRIKITDANTLIARYKEQLDNVRNNREFDNLTKEITYQGLEVELAEKRIGEFTAESKSIAEEIVKSKTLLEERKSDLRQKKEELNEIVSETKIQEEQLREKAKKIETTIEPRLLAAFRRIRKSARNGLAVVYIQRGACGGCFNKIPPQRQLDIRLRKKTIVCEHCGRILIDPQLAGVEE